MPAIVWPITLPALRLPGPSMTRDPGFIETPMDVGPPKRRRRTFATRRQYTVKYEFTGAQLALFDTFYVTTLGNGTLGFEIAVPDSEETRIVRFKDYPKFDKIVGGSNIDTTRWEGTLNLEARDA